MLQAGLAKSKTNGQYSRVHEWAGFSGLKGPGALNKLTVPAAQLLCLAGLRPMTGHLIVIMLHLDSEHVVLLGSRKSCVDRHDGKDSGDARDLYTARLRTVTWREYVQ